MRSPGCLGWVNKLGRADEPVMVPPDSCLMRSGSSFSFLPTAGSVGRGVVRESNRTLGCCLSRTAELKDRPTVAPRA